MEIKIPFTLTAAQVNTLDTSPVSIVTGLESTLIYEPKKLILKKNAGTAYALTASVHPGDAPRGVVVGDSDSTSIEFSFNSGLVVSEVQRESGSLFSERPVFYVPSDGFLNSARAQSRIALPYLSARVFQPGTQRFRIRLLDSIASGTGSLEGWLCFEQHSIGQ